MTRTEQRAYRKSATTRLPNGYDSLRLTADLRRGRKPHACAPSLACATRESAMTRLSNGYDSLRLTAELRRITEAMNLSALSARL